MKPITPLLPAVLAALTLAAPSPAAAEARTEAQQLCDEDSSDSGQVTSYLKVKKCGQSAPAAAQDNGPVARCLQARSQYDAAADDVKRLVSNPSSTPLVPPGGWRNAAAAQWVQDKREMRVFSINDAEQDLTAMQEWAALNQEVVSSCDAALQAALGANFISRRSMMKELGGDDFENNWPSRKGLLAAELRAVQQAIQNMKSITGL